MNNEDKELLLKDLCARLPYGVKLHIPSFSDTPQLLQQISDYETIEINDYASPIDVDKVKSYLRPMSSMTEEERYEIQGILGKDIEIIDDFINIIDSSRKRFSFLELQAVFDWLNAHHFDYIGLIKRGLALEAQKDMYKN